MRPEVAMSSMLPGLPSLWSVLLPVLTVLGVITGCLLAGVVGFKGTGWLIGQAAEAGALIGARRRLAAGTGGWEDLSVYLRHRTSRHLTYEDWSELSGLCGWQAGFAQASPWIIARVGRPDLPPAIFAWLRDGHPARLLLEAIETGYNAPALDAHRAGTTVLDADAMAALRALRGT